jgi:hypothetical protein
LLSGVGDPVFRPQDGHDQLVMEIPSNKRSLPKSVVREHAQRHAVHVQV